jgi:hypothetical protein
LRRIPTIQVRIGADLESVRSDLHQARIARPRPTGDLEQVIVNRPISVRYEEDDGISLDLPAGRFLELRGTLGTVHTVVIAPQLGYLDEDGAIDLVEALSGQAEDRGWDVRRRFWGPGSLREQLKKEPGYFHTRYVETAKGQESLVFSLKRFERPSVLRLRKGRDGYLVNLAWNNAVLEEQLRVSLRAERGQGLGMAALQPERVAIAAAAAAAIAP